MTQPATDDEIIESIGPYNYGWHDSNEASQKARRGLSEEVVRDISAKKNEPEWMLEHRLKALNLFEKKPAMKVWMRFFGAGETASPALRTSFSTAKIGRASCRERV